MRTVALAFATLALMLVGMVFWGRNALQAVVLSPSEAGGERRLLSVPQGTDAPALIEQFQAEGLVRKSDLLRLYAEHLHEPGPIVPGEYRLGPGLSPLELIRRVERGRVYQHTFTLPAGSTVEEVARLLGERGLIDEPAFLAAAYDPELAARLGIDGPGVEGFLLPDVWALPRGLTPERLIARLVERFFQKVPDLKASAERLGLTPYQLVTLASLVQNGPVRGRERRLYAALLFERLQKGFALESDAADAYARERDPSDPRRNPWNTSARPGLPKTPIGSPSLATLRATQEPATTEPVYMVRRKNGRHVYCPTASCYLRALAKHAPGERPHFPRRFGRNTPRPR